MRAVAVIILHAFVAQAITKEDPVDKVADMLMNKLADKLTQADLDGTTLGKPQAALGVRTPSVMRAAQPLVPPTVRIAQENLMAHGINPGPLGTLALATIDANNRGIGMRNVAAMAMNLPSQDRAALSQLSKDVVVKAEAIKDMPGVIAPTGFFDPAGYSAQVSSGQLTYLREAELKHGRVGMIASLGFIMGEQFSSVFGAGAQANVPAVQLVGQSLPAVPAQFWGAIIVLSGFAEMFLLNSKENNPSYTPGDYGFDPMGMKPKEPKKLLELQNKELSNGRLAMLAAAGMIAQELVTGQKIFR